MKPGKATLRKSSVKRTALDRNPLFPKDKYLVVHGDSLDQLRDVLTTMLPPRENNASQVDAGYLQRGTAQTVAAENPGVSASTRGLLSRIDESAVSLRNRLDQLRSVVLGDAPLATDRPPTGSGYNGSLNVISDLLEESHATVGALGAYLGIDV